MSGLPDRQAQASDEAQCHAHLTYTGPFYSDGPGAQPKQEAESKKDRIHLAVGFLCSGCFELQGEYFSGSLVNGFNVSIHEARIRLSEKNLAITAGSQSSCARAIF